jgi:mannose-6-phosphate isomerase-like protein (cupin superfamily)
MLSLTGKLIEELQRYGLVRDCRPWGVMLGLNAPDNNITIKYITIDPGKRTSEQYHKSKLELLIILDDFQASGYVETGEDGRSIERHVDGPLVYIGPGVRHRVTGPIEYLEVSTYDDDTDTVRVNDDYGRVP